MYYSPYRPLPLKFGSSRTPAPYSTEKRPDFIVDFPDRLPYLGFTSPYKLTPTSFTPRSQTTYPAIMPSISHKLAHMAREADLSDPDSLRALAQRLKDEFSPTDATCPNIIFRLVATSELYFSMRDTEPLTPAIHQWAAQKVRCKKDNLKIRRVPSEYPGYNTWHCYHKRIDTNPAERRVARRKASSRAYLKGLSRDQLLKLAAKEAQRDAVNSH